MTRYNKCFNRQLKRTCEPLYQYYKPKDFYDEKGYYSKEHDKIYYDGYGYNFYTALYAYYETSIDPKEISLFTVKEIVITCLVLIVLTPLLAWKYTVVEMSYYVEKESCYMG